MSRFGIERLEQRRLMTAVLSNPSYDPIAGPVDTTSTQTGSLLPQNSGGFFFLGFGGVLAVGTDFGLTNQSPSQSIRPTSTFNADLFFRKSFPFIFSSGASMRFRNGVLTLTGTHAGDTILLSRVTLSDGSFSSAFDLTVNGQTQRLDGSGSSRFIRSIAINSGDGDDLVTLDEDFPIALNVHGGRGNDSIAGGAGNDKLFGDTGNDYLIAGSGSNLLNGGAGNDTLAGGSGNDTLLGGVGNDHFLNSGDDDSHDLVTGGKGKNTAEQDLNDILTDVIV